MATARQKETVLTFKADASLVRALKNIPNRSEFIREAILGALRNHCPMCHGSGVLSPNQKRHWEEFAKSHALRECDDCHEIRIVCANEDDGSHTHG